MHATLETRIDRQLHEDKIVSPKPNLKKKTKQKKNNNNNNDNYLKFGLRMHLTGHS